MTTMRILVVGDVHGNSRFLRDWIFPAASKLNCHAILQVGDFGYWEHTKEGVQYLDDVAYYAATYDMPLYFLPGNHDNRGLAEQKYSAHQTIDGFYSCRPQVNYIPNGYLWTWAGYRLRSFGGAYSIDKTARLEQEEKQRQAAWKKEEGRRRAGQPAKSVPSFRGTLWFPDEEMSDEEFERCLDFDNSKIDIIFSHDKPASASLGPGFRLKDDPECQINQQRLQRALRVHQPDWWFHGHFHLRYQDTVRSGDNDRWTTVIGLGCDDYAASMQGFSRGRPSDAWCVLDLGDEITVSAGREVEEIIEEDIRRGMYDIGPYANILID